jgi:hypothetical protein
MEVRALFRDLFGRLESIELDGNVTFVQSLLASGLIEASGPLLASLQPLCVRPRSKRFTLLSEELRPARNSQEA